MNYRNLRPALRLGMLPAAVAVALVPAIAGAQEAPASQATTLDRIEVTGSRIKRVDMETAAPITTISRQDIEAAGELSVSDFLRNNVYNSFGSTRESSGSATGSFSTISLRGLGSAYTLVLLDGRRMTASGSLDGGAANINMIPTSAVERIEILREGAGAIYGSDAIGGVVNIILRKDYEGLTVAAGYETSSGPGPNGNTFSVSGGVSSDRGNVTFVLDHQERDMMYNRDIRGQLADAGYAFGLSTYNSSATFAGPGGLVSAPNCDTFENSYRISPTRCGFDHGATSANESSLSRDALLINGNFDLTDNTSAFFRGLNSNTESLGVYASAPVDNAGRGPGVLPTIAASNPFNPFGVDGTLYYRFTPLGTRDSVRRDTHREYTLGLKGMNDLFGGADWELAVTHGKSALSSVNYNYGIGSTLQALIDAGQYNPFDPTHPSVAAAGPMVGHTVLVETANRSFGADGHIGFDLFDMPAGAVSVVTGFEYRDDRLDVVYDAQSAAGNVFGSAGAGANGERAYYAGYFEALIPVLDTLDFTLAGRYDSYNDVGSKFSPRVSMEFRPIDSLLFRGSWGEGFRAPTLADLYGASSATNLNSPPVSTANPPHPGGDELACAALQAAQTAIGNPAYQPYPVNPCASTDQYVWIVSSNENLIPEESTNWGLGAVWSPNANVSVALDYYDVELENVISTVPRGVAFRNGDNGVPGYGVIRGNPIIAPNGAVLPGIPNQIMLPVDNGAVQTVRGVDFEANYRVDTGAAGSFNGKLTWSHTLEYDFTPIVGGTIEYAGTAGYPEDRASLALGWSRGDFDVTLITNYIGSSSNDAPDESLPSWVTYDLQAGVNLPWNARVALGARNLANKQPPYNDNLYGFPYYDNGLYNIYGRMMYMNYTQNF
ncbi:TonB-dependent receptor plug domain-containing protein [Novilysobacter antarcticus]|uniref:TonB-dependent receptor plug domain-containing protein n=1 Tax=Novilysobacter antarcticus TaxID=2862543 RepID=UPI001C9A0FC3|nr:TonB-dependent receptor [Lysobacter antarcticus]